MRLRHCLLCTLLAGLLVSCKDGDDTTSSGLLPWQRRVEVCVAVVAPTGDAATKTRLERTAQWMTDNLKEATKADTVVLNLKIEWHDELTEDLTALSQQLAARQDIAAIVGPFGNESMARFAPACQQTHKPLIAPTTTSEDILRRYAVSSAGSIGRVNKELFFWPLCESDVSLCEKMLSHYATQIGKYTYIAKLTTGVFAPADNYGQTFYEWSPFLTRNMGIELQRNDQYTSTDELLCDVDSFMDHLWEHPSHNLLAVNYCVVETSKQMYDVAQARRRWVARNPDIAPNDETQDESWQTFESIFRTWFVFPAISQEGVEALGEDGIRILQGYQGFSPYADPATGFEKAYEERFGSKPTFAECKLYDGLLLTALASCLKEHVEELFSDTSITQDELMNFMIMLIGMEPAEGNVTATEPVWQADGMRRYLAAMLTNRGEVPALCGASGHIVFDLETSSQIACTTYLHWQIDEGQIRHVTYYGPDGKQVVNSSVSWDIVYDEDTAQKDFADMATDQNTDIQYPPLNQQYAILVQGSNSMLNYRHQADVLSVYQMLRRGGIDDDHIILILDGALAYNPQNNEQGVIRNSPWGENLLDGAEVDYDNDTLVVRDICDILRGRASSHLPKVLPQDEENNVLFYWSGHGHCKAQDGYNELAWLKTPTGQGMTDDLLRQTAEEMLMRKMLVITEPCYSEAVILPLQGLIGVLAMSGASGEEPSWGENRNPGLGPYGTWMCDRFTLNVVRGITADPTITYRDLYFYCMRNTIGSHVKLVNADYFGNLYRTGPMEFTSNKQRIIGL